MSSSPCWKHAPVAHLEGYLKRGDFSRWIGDIFGDYPLAAELRALEEQHRAGASRDPVPEIVAAIGPGTTWWTTT